MRSSTATFGSGGDQQKLLDNQAVFGALDAVFAAVKEKTTYE